MKDHYYSNLAETADLALFSKDKRGGFSNNGKYSAYFKRAFDLIFSILLLPVLAPLIGVIWLLVKRDGGPGFFTQERVGQNGKKFICWKVRTMAIDAEKILKDMCDSNPEIAADWAKNQKLKNDPRITKIGAFLRSTSLDELPQLWNVLKGDMSLVGPRPFMTSQEQGYRSAGGKLYFEMRPGVTGFWQIEGRGVTTFNDRIPYDDSYRANLSFLTDAVLILKTVAVIFRRTGH